MEFAPLIPVYPCSSVARFRASLAGLLSLLAGCLALTQTANWAAEASPSVVLFNGKDITGWTLVGGRGNNQWKVGTAALDKDNESRLTATTPGNELVSPVPGANLATTANFGDCILDFEFLLAKRSNSGVKLMNIYEIQLFDSIGKTNLNAQDCGAVYSEVRPKVNACKEAGQWQTLRIEFRAPRFDANGTKTANAKFVKVVLNGQVVQDGVEIAHGTNVSRNAKEHPTGPIYLQGDHGPVAFRNFKLTPLN
jgi:hypothetical protein